MNHVCAPTSRSRDKARRGRTTDKAQPLLSACMIVKDEEANLPSCLAALNRVVDEVVVYDTGSTDRTVEIARAAGARVIEGYWDDDFARARNASLEHCRGQWVLHVDADEVLECDPRGLRGALEYAGDTETLSIEIYNLSGDGYQPGVTHRAIRFFQRAQCHWSGRLHEQVVMRDGRPSGPTMRPLTGSRLVHSGYVDSAINDKDKLDRNVRLAEQDRADAGEDDLEKAFNLARSLAAAGRHEEAIPYFRQVRSTPGFAGPGVRMSLLFGIQSLIELDLDDEAGEWCDFLRSVSATSDLADFLRARLARRAGRSEESLALLRSVGALCNEDGYSLPAGQLEGELAATLLDLGRLPEAATVLLELLEQTVSPTTVAVAAETLLGAGRSLAELAAAVPAADLIRACAALTVMDPVLANEVANSLLDRFGPRPQLLAASVRFAPRLGAGAALEWSARLRDIGMAADCPLIARAGDDRVPPAERVLAAVTAYAAFADERGPQAALGAASGLCGEDRERSLHEVSLLAPDLLERIAAIPAAGHAQERQTGAQVPLCDAE